MKLDEFYKELKEDIYTSSVAYGDGSCAEFVYLYSEHLITSEVISEFNPSFYVGFGKNSRKLRVDGYYYDEYDKSMNIIIADYSADDWDRTLTKSDAIKNFEFALRFIDETISHKLHERVEISTATSDLIDEITTQRNSIEKYRILLFSNGIMSGRIDSIETQQLGSIPVEFHIWDVQRIYNIVKDASREPIHINFTEYIKNGIPCLDANIDNTIDYRSYLCVIPATFIADIYDKYGSRLLEGNVRSFLSTKGSVNKNIRKTIIESPQMFFAFNNGVSVTAKNLVIESNSNGKFILSASDFQIINGGQTTASLSSARFKDKANLENISLQMKLTEIINKEDQASEIKLTENISKSSNSQNKVSEADFFSSHVFHVRMESFSRKLWASATGGAQYDTHWFYERARGQYVQSQMKMSAADKNKFTSQNPKDQLITKTDFAKVRNTWSSKPHIVSKGAQTNFIEYANWITLEWNKSDVKFNEKYFKETVALIEIFKGLEKSVSRQPWYQNGYRANIVTYSLALFNELIQNQYPNKTLDLISIWNKQDSPLFLIDELTIIAKIVLDSITDRNNAIANVTQWCKREACWNKIKSIEHQLDNRIETLCLDIDEINDEEKSAKMIQKEINGIESQKVVLELGAEYFKRLREYSHNKIFLSQKELLALNTACNIPQKIPADYQCDFILDIIKRAEDEGWLR